MKTPPHHSPILTRWTRLSLGVAILWSLTLFGQISMANWRTIETNRLGALAEARTHIEKDMVIRTWATMHGGVFVPVSEQTPPNPYLAHIPERDITTPSGVQLTLMNPAYIMRQINDLFNDVRGAQAHIASLNPLNPANTPDAWERAALQAFEEGQTEAAEFLQQDGRPVLRLMRPLITREGCLKCHAAQGYQAGDLRGGISIALSLTDLYQRQQQDILIQTLALGILWLGGLAVIAVFYLRWRQHLSERVLGIEKVEASEARYRALFEDSPISLWEEDLSGVRLRLMALHQHGVADMRSYLQAHPETVFECMTLGKILDINRATLRLFAAQSKEELLTNLSKIIPPEALDDFIEELLHIAAGDRYFEWTGPNLTLDGRLLYLKLSMSVQPGSEEDYSRVLLAMEDITAHREAELSIQQAQNRYRTLFEESPIALWEEDLSAVKQRVEEIGAKSPEALRAYLEMHPEVVRECIQRIKVLDVNQAAVRLYQAPSKAAFLNGISALITEEYLHNMVNELIHIYSSSEAYDWETVDTTFDGEKMLVHLKLSPVPGHEEDFSRVIVATENITARRAAEEKLRQSETRYRSLVENLPIGVYRVTPGPQGKFVMANPATLAILGFETEEQLKQVLISDLYVHPEERAKFSQRLLSEGSITGREVLAKRKDSQPRWLSVTAHLVNDDSGVYFDCTMEDINDRKLAEERAYRLASRLEAVAQVAHRITMVTDVRRMTGEVAALLREALSCYGVNVFLLKNEVLEFYNGNGDYTNGAPRGNLRIKLGEGLIGGAAQTRKLLLSPNVQTDPRFIPWDELPKTRCEMAVPLLSGDKLLGVLDIQEIRLGAFDETDSEALSALAGQLAVALENARLFEETRLRLRRLSALRSMDVAISSSFDLQVTFNLLLDQLTNLLKVDAACIWIYDPPQHSLEFAAERGLGLNRTRLERQRLDRSLAGQAARLRRLVQVPDIKNITDSDSQPAVSRDFTAYLAVPLLAKGQIQGVLEVYHRSPLQPDAEWIEFLETLAGDAAIAIDNASLFANLQRSNAELAVAYDRTLEGWARALELRDHEIEGHSQRVTNLAVRLGREIGLNDADLLHLRRGALLHDIGKMGVPDQILHKPGPLDEQEWQIMRRHPKFAEAMLSPIPYLKPALDIPLYHHEKWDGSGYPYGLKGALIPLPARIFALVDVWDALLSERSYRPPWSREQTVGYIQEQSGSHFDPAVVEAFLKLLLNLEEW